MGAQGYKVASNTAERQLRAYVVTRPPIWSYPVDDSDYSLTIVWENCGATPARNCFARTSRGVFEKGVPENFDYPDVAAEIRTEASHIGPGQPVNSTIGFARSDVGAAQRGGEHLFVWGWIEYDDGFPNTPRRRTEVCFEASIIDGGQSCTTTIVGPFNAADEDCYHKPKT